MQLHEKYLQLGTLTEDFRNLGNSLLGNCREIHFCMPKWNVQPISKKILSNVIPIQEFEKEP